MTYKIKKTEGYFLAKFSKRDDSRELRIVAERIELSDLLYLRYRLDKEIDRQEQEKETWHRPITPREVAEEFLQGEAECNT